MDISHFISFRNKWSLFCTLILLTIIGLSLQWLGYSIYTFQDPRILFIKSIPDTVISITFLLYLVVLYLMLIELFEFGRKRYLEFKNNRYVFRNRDWPERWLFSGIPEIIGNSELLVKWTRAGCLLKDYSWKNFRMKCKVKFLPKENYDQTVGLVFRAENLDNYFMIELSNKHKNIKPHVRYKGGWDILQPVFKDYEYKDYFSVVLELKEDTAFLFIDEQLEYTWILPTHVDVIYRESGVGASSHDQDQEKKESDKGKRVAEHVQEIPFRTISGMIGFRAHPGQGAIIKGLRIEPL